jgi:argininosuccinate synthase
VANEYANLVYNGLWFTPLRGALDAFVNETQHSVTGMVRIKLLKGRTIIAGRKSPFSLYNTKLATYTEEDSFNHKASEGFITIFGLPAKTYNQVHATAESQGKAKGAKDSTSSPASGKP